MRLALTHARADTLELLRYPSFSVPTLLLPAVGFVLFGLGQAAGSDEASLASFAAIGLLSVAFFQFGVGIAADRASPWQVYLRTLPASPAARFAARVLSALAFGTAAVIPIVLLAVLATEVTLSAGHWVLLAATLLLGSVPFCLAGVALGYWLTPRGALPIANLLFLGLMLTGGLFLAGRSAPEEIQRVAGLPTSLWSELLVAAVGEGSWSWWNVAGLSAYAVAFGLLALWGYRRDEGEKFR